MKKIKIMLPVLAVVFAVGAAIAGDFFSPISAYYQNGSGWGSGLTEQDNCQLNAPEMYPICTIKVGTSHKQAFGTQNVQDVLRNVTPQ